MLCLPGVQFNHWCALYYLVLWRCACAFAAEPFALNFCIAQIFFVVVVFPEGFMLFNI